jgi:MoaA/NifB/PqqE/SkfB family radical SAM enzyme
MARQKNYKPLRQKALFRFVAGSVVNNSLLRKGLIRYIHKRMWNNLVKTNKGKFPRQVQIDKIDMGKALFDSIHRNMKKKLLSKQWITKFTGIHLANLETRGEKVRAATKRLGFEPPLFITVSPGKKCNLNCPGCYACSTVKTIDKLDWDTFDRILTEKRDMWGSYLTVISGGEPFLWEDKGKNLLDMVKKHDKQFFMVYTNGTLIDKTMARQLAELGSLTPAFSVEGYEEETNRRRGKGVFKKILQGMENLREVGVPFGISITAMRQNWDVVSRDDFLDFWFEEQGATYGWIFQYMPIGDRSTFDMVVTPEQRMVMLKRLWKSVREKKYFMADFWNSGTVTSGCIAGGRPGGYFYITWSGDITPCVFVPYSETNIMDIYKNGGTLEDAIMSPLMKRVRKWQASYGFTLLDHHSPHGNWECHAQNWLAPCFIRDHFENILEAANAIKIKPIDPGAEISLDSEEYHQWMLDYGREFSAVSSEYWNSFYLAGDKQDKIHANPEQNPSVAKN